MILQEENVSHRNAKPTAATIKSAPKPEVKPQPLKAAAVGDSSSGQQKQQLKRQEVVLQELQRLKSSGDGANGKTAAAAPAPLPDDPEALELHPCEEFDEPSSDSPQRQQLRQPPVVEKAAPPGPQAVVKKVQQFESIMGASVL